MQSRRPQGSSSLAYALDHVLVPFLRLAAVPSYILLPPEAESTATCVSTCTSCLHTASTAYTYSIVSPATIFSLRRNVLLTVVRCYAVSPSTLLLNLPRPFIMARAETCRPSYSTSLSIIGETMR